MPLSFHAPPTPRPLQHPAEAWLPAARSSVEKALENLGQIDGHTTAHGLGFKPDGTQVQVTQFRTKAFIEMRASLLTCAQKLDASYFEHLDDEAKRKVKYDMVFAFSSFGAEWKASGVTFSRIAH